MALYTSRFHNRTLATWPGRKLAFCQGPPRFPLPYEWANLRAIAPDSYIRAAPDEQEFQRRYLAKLDKLGLERVAALLAESQGDSDDLVLLCYEDIRIAGEWCHRRMFAFWWFEHTGEIVVELEDPATPKGQKKASPAVPGPLEQVGLFDMEDL